MYLYQVGDQVRVRQDLNSHQTYFMVGNPKSHNSATSEMVKLAGQVVTISATDCGQYRVFECSRWLYWTDEMFDGLADDGVAFELDLEDIF